MGWDCVAVTDGLTGGQYNYVVIREGNGMSYCCCLAWVPSQGGN